MEPAIASYEFHTGGWRWLYELFPDKLIATGTSREARQYFEFELKHAHDIPDRGVSTLGVRYPLVGMAGVMVLTLGLFVALFLFQMAGVLRAPWPENDLVILFIASLVLELSAALLAPHVWGTRNLQRFVAFKRVSDGGELLRLHSVVNPTDDAFERFVEEIIAAIRLRKPIDTPADFSFKA